MRGSKSFFKALKGAENLKTAKRIAARPAVEEKDFGEIDEEKTRENVEKLLRDMRRETEAFRFMEDAEILGLIEYCCEAQKRMFAAVVSISKGDKKDER